MASAGSPRDQTPIRLVTNKYQVWLALLKIFFFSLSRVPYKKCNMLFCLFLLACIISGFLYVKVIKAERKSYKEDSLEFQTMRKGSSVIHEVFAIMNSELKLLLLPVYRSG